MASPLKEGAIRSVDDLAETYVPGLKDTEYGRTPIKALLLMASGVAFSEDYASRSSDIYRLARMTIERDPGDSLAAVKQFNTRRAAPGARFSYSSAETVVLGLVLAAATKRTVSDYAAEKLWQPLGAEADATWIIDATGQEITFAYVNAVLRDWARLGLMLANHGNWQGKTVVPEDWLKASAANALPTDPPLAKYGYQIWYSEDTSRFSLRGLRGQYVLVDPALKLVLVQTALVGGQQEFVRVACSMERAASTVSVVAVQAAALSRCPIMLSSSNMSAGSTSKLSLASSSGPSLACRATIVRPLVMSQNDRLWRAPCKGGAFQWVQVPPGRSSRKQSEHHGGNEVAEAFD